MWFLMTTKTNKMIGAALAVTIIISIGILIYVNLPKQTDVVVDDDNNTAKKTAPSVFSLIYDDEQKNFTLSGLQQMETYTAKGGYRTQTGFIKGFGNYTGVNITTLVGMFSPVPYRFSLMITSEDTETQMFNYTTIQGQVYIYDVNNASNPDPIGKGNLTMMLAFQYEGNWLDQSNDGTLKIVFVDEQGSITQSSLWWKKVISMRIITE